MPAIASRQAAQPLESDKAKESKRTPFNEKGVLSTFTGVIYEKTKEKTEQPHRTAGYAGSFIADPACAGCSTVCDPAAHI